MFYCYQQFCLPYLLDLGCGLSVFSRQRKRIVPLARGRVLEIGFGSGRNITFYDASSVTLVQAVEPSKGMRRIARNRIARTQIQVQWVGLRGEEIPLDDHSVDTVLLTYTLCSIDGYSKALQEMYRVLKPEGKLLFCEHGLAPDPDVACWQRRFTPLWRKLSGGCRLDRPVVQYLEHSGFKIQSLDAGYLPNTPKVGGYHYLGVASAD